MSRRDRQGEHRGRLDRGQAAVEFAIALPVVVLAALAIVQMAVVVRDQLAVEHAAREAARAASVAAAGSPSGPSAAATATAVDGIEITVTDEGGRVTAVATKPDVTALPIVGVAVGDLEVSATVTMLIEPP